MQLLLQGAWAEQQQLQRDCESLREETQRALRERLVQLAAKCDCHTLRTSQPMGVKNSARSMTFSISI